MTKGLIQALTNILYLTIGIYSGYIGFSYYGPITDLCQIKYVSEEEIMQLEKQRVAQLFEGQIEKELFFGKIDRAVELTTKLADRLNDRQTKIIFTISPVYAKGVESISKDIYERVMEKLK